ncbi:MAG: FAD-dependent oxidoreductase [Desulfuromonadales bacterium]|nr:FAD-dependent oxidoreductase [Desulfuromonadales bacterium]
MQANETRCICTVCGYVHQGTAPPDCCPICGATPDLFELQTRAEPQKQESIADQWACLNCEYIHHGSAPPATCPVCSLSADQFEPCKAGQAPTQAEQRDISVVIVGAGIAGVSAAEAVRKAAPSARITLLSKEPDLPYFRLNLTRYLAGEITVGDLNIHPQQWYRDNGIDLRTSTELRDVNIKNGTLTLHNHEQLTFDRLILAMGSHAFVPPIPGANRENVTVLRTLRDADFILGQVHPGLNCTIIGGGVLGLETAGALARRGAKVTQLEGFGWLMPQQLNRNAGDLLARHAENLGIKIRTDVRIKQIDGDERVRSVVLENGENIASELVIIAAGVRSNSYLLRQAQLEVNQGVVINDYLRTSDDRIFAVGDIAEHRGLCYGTWAPAQFQGAIAGLNAVGGQVEFAGIPRSNTLKVLNFDLFSIGQVHPNDGSYLSFEALENGRYHYIVFRDGQLVGAILLGDMRLAAAIKHLIEAKTCCTDLLHGNPGMKEILAFIEAKPH